MNQQTFSLSAQKRDASDRHSARETRVGGRVPAVVYGHGTDSFTVSVDQSDILRTYRTAGQSSLVNLDVDGKNVKVLIQEISLHPVTRTIQHVDFYAVNLKETTNVNVPIDFVGESPAIKDLGGVLMKENDEIEIRCLPTDIPHELTVDISTLENVGDSILVSDLHLDPEKFRVFLEPDTVLCSIAAPRIEVEEEETTEEAGEGAESDSEESKSEESDEKEEASE